MWCSHRGGIATVHFVTDHIGQAAGKEPGAGRERFINNVALPLSRLPEPSCIGRWPGASVAMPTMWKEHCLVCHATPYHNGKTCQEHAAASGASSSSGGNNRTTLDEEASLRDWMERTGSRQCPRCKMGVTKEDLGRQKSQRAECHKMMCRNCETRFCFKCLTVLKVARPVAARVTIMASSTRRLAVGFHTYGRDAE
eukprot:CAMPEP_0172765724 /NCGR_PEP_ID=MMETSP1074-20121228/179848_1 /TAXON_ID=2916 /ORGANISM="Ceratium fusus, Strain PA161109" /LENGTH=196 /DNA_ID=CAMNT_0013600719 /DNA_START=265 /DNA_END=857 /DNA_ORIENTATION=+